MVELYMELQWKLENKTRQAIPLRDLSKSCTRLRRIRPPAGVWLGGIEYYPPSTDMKGRNEEKSEHLKRNIF